MTTIPAGLEVAANEQELAMLANVFAGVFASYILIAVFLLLAILILQIIADWFVFRKAGTGGWKSLIPIYRDYTYYKIAWKGRYFFLALLLGILGGVATSMSQQLPQYALWFSIAELACAIAVIVIEIKSTIKLAKVFGKGGGFAVGLIFLPLIFTCILGFGKAKYRRGKRRKKNVTPQSEAA